MYSSPNLTPTDLYKMFFLEDGDLNSQGEKLHHTHKHFIDVV